MSESTAAVADTCTEPTTSSPDNPLDEDDGLGILKEWQGYAYTPLEEAPVLTITMTKQFRHIYGLLYTVMETAERSDRALRLSTFAIRLNLSNPTAWLFRRQLALAHAEKDAARTWRRELAFTTSIIQLSRKNYQAWQHRRFAAHAGGLLAAEIELTDLLLHDDEKNYHAWSYRQWLVREHGLVAGELAATEWFIRTDVRNNSAWNHRWLVTGVVAGARNTAELEFAVGIMLLAPRNESAWNYIQALGRAGVDVVAVKATAKTVLETDAGCLPARRFLVLSGSREEAAEVREHCRILAAGVDGVRRRYWEMQGRAAEALLEQ